MSVAPHKKSASGFSVTEIVVGAAVIALVVTALASAWQYYLKLSGQAVRLAQATVLLEEGAEAVQYLRDKGWDTYIGALTPNAPYYLVWTGTDYAATTTPTLVNNSYTRTLTLSTVSRGASDNIVVSGTVDAGTMTATINIYASNATTSAPLLTGQMLIHDIFQN